MEGRPGVLLGVLHHAGPFGIEIDIEHDLQVIEIGLNDGGFESVHDYLAPPSKSLVIDPGEERVDDPEHVGEELFVEAESGQVRVIAHEAIGIDLDLIAVFVL